LLSRFWWGSIFLVNVPVVIAGVLGALFLVPDSKNPAAAPPDPVGAALSIVGLGLLLWSIIEGPTMGWTSGAVLGVLAASLVVLGSFVGWEAHSSHPMLKLSLFSNRRFSIAALGETLGTFGLLGALFVQTQFLQFDLGYSPLQAGLRILPIAATLVLVAVFSPFFVRLIGVSSPSPRASRRSPAVFGRSRQCQRSRHVRPGRTRPAVARSRRRPLATHGNELGGRLAPSGRFRIGSASNAVALQVGGALGVAVIGSTLATRYQSRLTAALHGHPVSLTVRKEILGSLGGALAVARSVGGETGALLARAARSAFMSGVEVAFVVERSRPSWRHDHDRATTF